MQLNQSEKEKNDNNLVFIFWMHAESLTFRSASQNMRVSIRQHKHLFRICCFFFFFFDFVFIDVRNCYRCCVVAAAMLLFMVFIHEVENGMKNTRKLVFISLCSLWSNGIAFRLFTFVGLKCVWIRNSMKIR